MKMEVAHEVWWMEMREQNTWVDGWMARDGVGFEWMDKGSLPGSHMKISSADSQDGNVDKGAKRT